MKHTIFLLLNGLFFLQVGTAQQLIPQQHFSSTYYCNTIANQNNTIWLGTDQGIFTIDKNANTVEHLTKINSDLPDYHVQTLSTDQQNNTWIGTYDLALAVAPPSGNTWTIENYPDQIGSVILGSDKKIYSSVIDAAGTAWFGTNVGLVSYDGSQWSHHPIQGVPASSVFYNAPNAAVWDVDIDANGDLWVGSWNTLKYSNGYWTEYTPLPSMMSPLYQNLYVANNGDVWVVPNTDKVLRYDGTNWQTWELNIDYPMANPERITCIQEDANGHIYINANYNEGALLMYYDGNTWAVDSSFYTSLSRIEQFTIDTDGTFWAFGEQQMIKKTGASLAITPLSVYPTIGTAFTLNRQGVLYCYGKGTTISSVEQGNWNMLMTPSSLMNGDISILETAMTDVYWFYYQEPNSPLTLFQYNAAQNNWISHDNSTSQGVLKGDEVKDIHIFQNGVVWVLTEDSGIPTLLSYDNNQWQDISNLLTPNMDISLIASDQNNTTWWVENDTNTTQLIEYDGTNTTIHTAPNELALIQPWIDDDGAVWVAGLDGKVYQFENGIWVDYTYDTNTDNRIITGLLIAENQIFISTNIGLFQYDPIQALGEHYTRENSALSSNDINDIAYDAESKLWVAYPDIIGNVTPYPHRQVDVFTLSNNTAIELSPSRIEFELYPNPCQNVLVVELSDAELHHFQIVNSQGQIIQRFNTVEKTTYIPVATLSSGIYWLQNIDGHYSISFVKQ